MILVAYDGSADARAAIDRAAKLMPGAEATVLTAPPGGHRRHHPRRGGRRSTPT